MQEIDATDLPIGYKLKGLSNFHERAKDSCFAYIISQRTTLVENIGKQSRGWLGIDDSFNSKYSYIKREYSYEIN